MAKPRKIRRDSKLKELPERYRAQIAGWLKSEGWSRCLQRIAAELQITAGKSALYEAIAYWEAEAEFDGFEAMARAQAELEANAKGGMTADEMQEAVDRNFIMLAAQKKDTDLYKDLRYLRIADQAAKTKGRHDALKLSQKERALSQKDQEIKLAIEKFQFDGAKAVLAHLAELKTIARDRSLSEDDQIKRVQLRLWGAPPKEMETKA